MINYYTQALNHLCPACGDNRISSEVDFGKFPYSCGCSEKPEDLKYHFQIGYCENCGLIQQVHFPDPEILYSVTSHDGVGKIWAGHYSAFSDFISSGLRKKARLLEVGGGKGEIAKQLADSPLVSEITINDYKYRGGVTDKIQVIEGGFEECEFEGKFDIIFSSHVFEHVTNFQLHLKRCSELLEEDGAIYIAIPNFELWIEQGFLNAFVQEHTIYPSVYDIRKILSENGFRVTNVGEYLNHSKYIRAERSTTAEQFVIRSISESRERLAKYSDDLRKLINSYKLAIAQSEYCIFGAHIFAQILLFGGLEQSNCKSIYDNSAFKQGKYLYGTQILCNNPSEITNLPEGLPIIVNAGAYTNEIKAQLKSINPLIKIL